MSTERNHTVILLLHCLLLATFALLVFPLHLSSLFDWIDGQYMKILAEQQLHWMGKSYLGMNHFQGLGDIAFPVIFKLVPAFYIANHFAPLTLHDSVTAASFSVIVYTITAIQYFIGSYLIVRTFKGGRTLALWTAWLITGAVFPLLPPIHDQSLFYPMRDLQNSKKRMIL